MICHFRMDIMDINEKTEKNLLLLADMLADVKKQIAWQACVIGQAEMALKDIALSSKSNRKPPTNELKT